MALKITIEGGEKLAALLESAHQDVKGVVKAAQEQAYSDLVDAFFLENGLIHPHYDSILDAEIIE